MSHVGTFSEHVDAAPDDVFGLITDLGGLPSWNKAIKEVTELPSELKAGVVWKVRTHAQGSTWISTSEVIEIDRDGRRFSHRSQTDDGNPSFADWTWAVDPDGTGSKVTVAFDLYPKTFLRKYFAIHIRKPALRREVRASLAKLSAAVQRPTQVP